MEPTVGRIVHYVLDRGPRASEHRPAIVVNVNSPQVVSLQVFTDGHKGDTPAGDEAPNVFWRSRCAQDEERKLPGTWHWGERAESV